MKLHGKIELEPFLKSFLEILLKWPQNEAYIPQSTFKESLTSGLEMGHSETQLIFEKTVNGSKKTLKLKQII